MEYEIFDFFGGAGRVARAARECGMSAVAFDICYHNDPRVFDINTPAGFAFPSCTCRYYVL